MNLQDQKNLERVLSLDVATFNAWVVTLSNENLDYLGWLMDACEETLDTIMLRHFGLTEAKRVIDIAAAKQ
jgi:hypothetical protein